MNLQSAIDLDLKGFLHWWSRELAFLIPKKVRQLLSDCSGALIFTGVHDGFTLNFFREDQPEKPALSTSINDRPAYQQLLIQCPELEKADFVLQLNETHAIAKIIYLPEAVLENLQQVAGFELDRYTPFKPEEVYFVATPFGKTGMGQIKVLLVLTPRPILDDLLAQLNSWGIQPARVEFQSADTAIPPATGLYNLLPERYRPDTNPLAKSVHWLLNSLIFVLLMALLIYPVWQENQTVDILKSQIKALEKDTRLVDEQQFEIDTLREEAQKLIGIKRQTPELVPVLNELTHLLKDDTWLTNLQYSEKHMQIQGQSPAASSLIGVLETSPFFSKVSFVSPLTQDKGTGMERFQISMDVNAEPADTEVTTPPLEPGQAAPVETKP